MLYRLLSLLFLFSCGQPTQLQYGSVSGMQFTGLLYANTCSLGESFIVYNNQQFLKGNKSSPDLDKLIIDISNNQYSSYMLSSNGCQRVFNLEFDGEFEEETNILGNGGTESQNVIQVYKFRIPQK